MFYDRFVELCKGSNKRDFSPECFRGCPPGLRIQRGVSHMWDLMLPGAFGDVLRGCYAGVLPEQIIIAGQSFSAVSAGVVLG